jgi:hypothetical protein
MVAWLPERGERSRSLLSEGFMGYPATVKATDPSLCHHAYLCDRLPRDHGFYFVQIAIISESCLSLLSVYIGSNFAQGIVASLSPKTDLHYISREISLSELPFMAPVIQ